MDTVGLRQDLHGTRGLGTSDAESLAIPQHEVHDFGITLRYIKFYDMCSRKSYDRIV